MLNLKAWRDRSAADYGIILSIVLCIGIIALGTWLLQFELAEPDPAMGGFFYEWQRADPDFWSRATAWIGFALHQLAVWGTIYYAQKHYTTYTDKLRPANWVALGVNTLFIALHYAQTAIWYDGIAQDLPSWTAQFTVIMMLFVILAMENKRRGLFFGKKISFRREFYHWLREYHGYAFSFAVIYTFWSIQWCRRWGICWASCRSCWSWCRDRSSSRASTSTAIGNSCLRCWCCRTRRP